MTQETNETQIAPKQRTALEQRKRDAALKELGLTQEPVCLNCGGPAPFDSIANCRGNDMGSRVASNHGWKKYCSLTCKHAHCYTSSPEGNKKKSQATAGLFVLELPDGKQIVGKGMRAAAEHYGFHVPNLIQQKQTGGGYKLIKNKVERSEYPNLEFVDFTELMR